MARTNPLLFWSEFFARVIHKDLTWRPPSTSSPALAAWDHYMRIILVNPVSFEKWCWRNSVETGIGGSETSAVEMSWRLARRGHEVIVYAPLPDDVPDGSDWRGVKWYRIESVDYSLSGWWMLYRCPDWVDRFDHSRTDQSFNLMMQDWDYPDSSWTKERVERLDKIVVLCEAHKRWLLNRHPDFADKLWVTRNGIKVDLIEEVEGKIPWGNGDARNPKRIMYASSPDRGMLAALKIFRRAKEFVSDLELHLTYGFDNLDKMHASGNSFFKREKAECLKLIEETGAVMHGRVSQNDLYRMWFQTGICLYATTFWETGWITGLEAAAMGAIPVFSPIWAQGENMKHGVFVQGNPADPLTLARFVQAVVRLANDPGLQEQIRGPMMTWARQTWCWDNFVTQWLEAANANLQTV